MKRRSFVQALAALPFLTRLSWAAGRTSLRPPLAQRRFSSPAVEARLRQVMGAIRDPELAWTFEACFADTLDKAVKVGTVDGRPDTFLITGDIDAMWLRDSTAQVFPYLSLAKNDEALRTLLTGLIHRQTACLLIDPYANAFTFDPQTKSPHENDRTDMKPGVYERKYELDSLCYALRLGYGYWKATGDRSPFDARWREAVALVVKTMREQQRFHGPGPYKFESHTWHPAGTLWEGYGYPSRPCGLIHTAFRPSDDAGVYSFLVPANMFAVHTLRGLAEMQRAFYGDGGDAAKLAEEVYAALQKHALVEHPRYGRVYAFEVDGFGNSVFMDDANVPSLLAMPYLGGIDVKNADYQRTRKLILSEDNPYYYVGKVARGVGSIHTPRGWVWPVSIIAQALTSTDESEIARCIAMLRNTTAGKGQIHESFDPDDAIKFTREWFGWANVLFAELICDTFDRRPYLLG